MNFPPRDVRTFAVWLAKNQTGIPRSDGVRRALAGTLLAGLLGAVLTSRKRPSGWPLSALGLALAGGVAGPLFVTLATYELDRSLQWRDDLLGYSGVMRELFHAGELSLLGALGAGVAQASGGGARGLLLGPIGTSVLGALLYGARRLGPGVGAGAGLLSGVAGGLLVAAFGSPAPEPAAQAVPPLLQ